MESSEKWIVWPSILGGVLGMAVVYFVGLSWWFLPLGIIVGAIVGFVGSVSFLPILTLLFVTLWESDPEDWHDWPE